MPVVLGADVGIVDGFYRCIYCTKRFPYANEINGHLSEVHDDADAPRAVPDLHGILSTPKPSMSSDTTEYVSNDSKQVRTFYRVWHEDNNDMVEVGTSCFSGSDSNIQRVSLIERFTTKEFLDEPFYPTEAHESTRLRILEFEAARSQPNKITKFIKGLCCFIPWRTPDRRPSSTSHLGHDMRQASLRSSEEAIVQTTGDYPNTDTNTY